MIGFYNDNIYYEEIYKYLNLKIEDMCNNKNITFIDVKGKFNEQENVNIYEKILKKVNL